MNERWEQVTSLFAAARALDERTRASFLAIACDGDESLRAELEGLLEADEPDDTFLQDPPWARLARSFAVQLTSGDLLKDRYRVHGELGAGGQALVYRATDVVLNRSVVIKVMRSEGRSNSWLKSRFEQEMQALARIDHAGVVGILDVGELSDASPFLVIQHIDGMSLREALSGGPMPPARVAEILRQIGSALEAAHAAGIAHRDLKPENVMLLSQDNHVTVKLIDFGIAKIDRSDLAPSTTAVMIEGTVRYMAPEQFEGMNSTASDIYSMAVIACEMLSGQPHIRALPKSTPSAVRAALEAALDYRPDERPRDVRSWSDALADALNTERKRAHRLVAGISLTITLVAATAATQQWVIGETGEPVRIIEKVGAFDPLTEGFTAHHDVTGRIVNNPTRTGYDAWRIITRGQGYYYRTFTTAQKRRALERGWKLTSEMKAEEGFISVGADFAGAGGRFDIVVIRDGDREIVRLQTQIVPDLRGMDFVQTPVGQYHEYELVYDPNLKSADLWVDKELRLTGYPGFAQYQENRGLLFAASVYRTEHGSGAFRSVRFEITP